MKEAIKLAVAKKEGFDSWEDYLWSCGEFARYAEYYFSIMEMCIDETIKYAKSEQAENEGLRVEVDSLKEELAWKQPMTAKDPDELPHGW